MNANDLARALHALIIDALQHNRLDPDNILRRVVETDITDDALHIVLLDAEKRDVDFHIAVTKR